MARVARAERHALTASQIVRIGSMHLHPELVSAVQTVVIGGIAATAAFLLAQAIS